MTAPAEEPTYGYQCALCGTGVRMPERWMDGEPVCDDDCPELADD